MFSLSFSFSVNYNSGYYYIYVDVYCRCDDAVSSVHTKFVFPEVQ